MKNCSYKPTKCIYHSKIIISIIWYLAWYISGAVIGTQVWYISGTVIGTQVWYTSGTVIGTPVWYISQAAKQSHFDGKMMSLDNVT